MSVVISNYNYESFVGRAVESALCLDWADLEVIVVDDGSTDGSLQVLEAFKNRITLISVENGGQREALNLGYSRASGDAVIFLDSDDLLPVDLPARLNRALIPGVSKVQFRVQYIDQDGRPFGTPFPRLRRSPTSAEIRRWVLETTAYPTPPASGNAYSRWFLDRVMPLGPEIGSFSDSGLLALAPLLGNVVEVPEVVVGYRRHGANDSDLGRSPENFIRECERALARWNYALSVIELAQQPDRVFKSREVLQFRAAAARLTPDRRLPKDSKRRIFWDSIAALWNPGPESAIKRVAIATWSAFVVLGPQWAAQRLVGWRFGKAKQQ